MDYLICSPDVIHSWSFGTREGLEEIRREIDYNSKNPGKGDYYGYYTPDRCTDCIFGKVDDQPEKEWKKEALDKKVVTLQRLANSDLPRVICREDQNKCVAEHFSLTNSMDFGPVPIQGHSSTKPLVIKNEKAVLYVDEELVAKDSYADLTQLIAENSPSLEIRIIGNGTPAASHPHYRVVSKTEFLRTCQTAKNPVWIASPKKKNKNTVNFSLSDYLEKDDPEYLAQMYLLALSRAKLALKGKKLGLGPVYEYDQRAAATAGSKIAGSLSTAFRYQHGQCQKLVDYKSRQWTTAPQAECLLNR